MDKIRAALMAEPRISAAELAKVIVAELITKVRTTVAIDGTLHEARGQYLGRLPTGTVTTSLACSCFRPSRSWPRNPSTVSLGNPLSPLSRANFPPLLFPSSAYLLRLSRD